MERKSQADRMLEALTDCQWHAIGELHNSWGIGRPNSRANDLRGRGLEIEYRRVPGEANANVAHQYRLARPLEEVASACDVGAASSSGFAGTITDDTPSSRVPVRVDVPQSVESSGVEPLAISPDQLVLDVPVTSREREAA